ncbi:MAG: TRAP transporter substrate-binding protein [Hyphomicrobiales bacterium]|nr:TRAP transporter substrate-binding protein [Hyphomicrobiales bacterium]MCP5372190.1 TRAP transporter substrate-binding protein [Hyphomicrobiales bacterium]
MIRLGTAILTAALLAASQPAAAQDTYKLRLGTFLPPVSALVKKTLTPWAETLRQETNGRLDIQIYPGGALGKNPAAQLKLVKDGIIDITFVVPSYTPGEFPDNEVIELPLTSSNAVEASMALHGLYERGLLRGYDDVKVLALLATPVYNLHLRQPYTGVASLKGRKIRVSTKVQQAIVEHLGATPVGNIPVTQLAESLSRDLIDGALLAWDAMLIFKVTPVATQHVQVPLGFTPLAILMNKGRYEAMPADLKAVFDRHVGMPLVAEAGKTFEGTARFAAKKAMESGKHTFVEPDDKTMAQWEARLAPVVKAWPGQHARGEELFQALLGELEKARTAK